MRIVEPRVELRFITPDALDLIEEAGRICYQSEPRGDSAVFVRKIMKLGHESVIEHAYASFRIICDRGVSHELVRHRICSYSQESTRYCNYSKDRFGGHISVVMPDQIRQHPTLSTRWVELMEKISDLYNTMTHEGIAPQVARSVLPTALKTELMMTANFREWRHFLKLRTSPKAHPQMIEVASQIGGILLRECPAVFEDCV